VLRDGAPHRHRSAARKARDAPRARRARDFQLLRADYTAIGHVTVDVLHDGSRQPGGTAFYSALQASRLGLRARILTRGVRAEIEELIEPFAGELELEVQPAARTTTLLTSGSGDARTQRVLAWAGEIAPQPLPASEILHLAPVARESPARWSGEAAFVGLTPQGLARSWSEPRGLIELVAPSPAQVSAVERCDAIVLNDRERASCAHLIARALRGGAVVAVTAGAAGTTLLLGDGGEIALRPEPVRNVCDDLGAGDVFAAAFFVAAREGSGPRDAARFASAAAALRIEGAGADAIAHRPAIETRLARAQSERPRE